jgi:radical SAM superfamily enzyme YgiQ (UPF0313 family)
VADQAEIFFIDGNREEDVSARVRHVFRAARPLLFGCTVMPGPQLRQAIPVSKLVRELSPDTPIVWGGYFASNHHKVVLESGIVDYVAYGPADHSFPELVRQLAASHTSSAIPGMFSANGSSNGTPARPPVPDPEALPALPYDLLDRQYSLSGYLKKTFLGRKTAAYHSSFGCPFTCSFCAVVPIYQARWKAKSAGAVYGDIKYLIDRHGADAVEFHDNNFFVSERRTLEWSALIRPEKIQWWGEGRIDTLDLYDDATLAAMRESGCRMIFFGAETGSDDVLRKMDKGGTQTRSQILKFARRLHEFDIIPEYSFVLGLPGSTPVSVEEQIDRDIDFIREVKEVNPQTEIIIYVYSPVPTEGSELFKEAKDSGFSYPKTLEAWLDPRWMNFDLRKNPMTPWLTPRLLQKIRDFETVLNGYYPTVSDYKLSAFQRRAMQRLSSVRYKLRLFRSPLELKALQRFWLRYRRPETEGFASD